MSRARRGTGEKAGDSFACLGSRPATVRARHFTSAGFRPQDGERQKKQSEATSLCLLAQNTCAYLVCKSMLERAAALLLMRWQEAVKK
ncbi:hypothetical protein AL522_22505 (plasmid) [Pantoea vagans]|nr:hypothetical protein AL522_22505 [Pantoea vagans]